MAENDEKELVGLDWKEPLYGDIFSERTQKTARNLLLVAVATLLISVFEVGIKTIPSLPLEFSKQPATLEIFIAVINLGLLMAYAMRVTTDCLRAREEWADFVRFFLARRVRDEFVKARQAEDEIMANQPGYDEPESDPGPWYENAIITEVEAQKRLAKLESQFGDRKVPRAVRHARLWLLGGGPLLIGFIAFVHTSGSVLDFVLAVVGIDR